MNAAIEQYAPEENTHENDNVSFSLPYLIESTCLHMQVRAGSKTKNLVPFAQRKLFPSDSNVPSVNQVTWNAFGDGISKAIACAEMMKRKSTIDFHQYVHIGYKRLQQVWKPVEADAELDSLKVNKDIPAISILLSKVPLVKSNELVK